MASSSGESEVNVQSKKEDQAATRNSTFFGYNKRQFTIITIFGFANLFASTIYALQAPFYPKEAELKGATATEYGFVLGIFPLVVVVMSPIYGHTLGFVNPRLVFNLGILVASAMSILLGFLDYIEDHVTFIALSFLLRILQACGDAAFVTSSFATIAIEFPDAVASTFATFETFSGIGLLVGPSLGGLLYELGGFLLPFLFMGGCLLLVAILTYFLLPEPDSRNVKKDDKEAEIGKSGIIAMLSIPTVSLAFFGLFISAASIGFLVSTLEPHLRENFGLTPAITGLIFMIDGGLYALSAPIWGKLCDKSGQINTIVYLTIGAVMTFVGFLVIGPPPFIPLPTILWLVCVGLVIHGLGTGASFVSAFVIPMKGSIANGFPEGLATYGVVSGLYAASLALGTCIGSAVGGVLLDNYGFKTSSLFVIVSQAVVIILSSIFLCVPSNKSRSKDPEKESLLKNEQSSNVSDYHESIRETGDYQQQKSKATSSNPGQDYGTL